MSITALSKTRALRTHKVRTHETKLQRLARCIHLRYNLGDWGSAVAIIPFFVGVGGGTLYDGTIISSVHLQSECSLEAVHYTDDDA